MILQKILENTLLPFALLLLGGGGYLLFRLGGRHLRHYFLSLKLLSGALDWKSSADKLAPFAAAVLARLFDNFPVAVAASYLAYNFYGPGIVFWLLASIPLVMSLEFVLASLAYSYRRKIALLDDGPEEQSQSEGNSIENKKKGANETKGHYRISNPATLIEKALPIPALRGFFGALSLLASLVQGAALPLLVLYFLAWELGFPYILSIGLFLALVVFLFATGGLGRLARFGRIAGATGLSFILLFFVAFFVHPRAALEADVSLQSIFALAANTFWPENFMDWLRMLTALGAFWGLVGIGGAKSFTLAGSIRSNYAAKAGFVMMATAPFSVLFAAPFTVYFVIQRFSFVKLAQTDALQLAFLLVAAVAFVVAGLLGWIATGRQIAAQNWYFFSRKNKALSQGESLFYTALLFLLFLFLFWLEKKPYNAPYSILLLSLLAAVLPAFFVITAGLLLHGAALHELRRYRESLENRYEILKDFALLLFHVLPKNLLSRLFGYLSSVHLPPFLRRPIITAFARAYEIDVEEAEGSIADYPSLNKFFTRALREGVRVIAHEPDVLVSPVDGRLSQFGQIREGLLIQAKGLHYRAADLLAGSGFEERLSSGSFAVLYLSPQDYHRIHSPLAGKILGYSYHPGQLFPVNRLMVEGLAGLFPKNERLSSFIEGDHGLVAVIKVGATNVGRIALSYDTIRANAWLRREQHVLYDAPKPIARGAELGRFEMGSTVILLVEDQSFAWLSDFQEGNRVRYGQILGHF